MGAYLTLANCPFVALNRSYFYSEEEGEFNELDYKNTQPIENGHDTMGFRRTWLGKSVFCLLLLLLSCVMYATNFVHVHEKMLTLTRCFHTSLNPKTHSHVHDTQIKFTQTERVLLMHRFLHLAVPLRKNSLAPNPNAFDVLLPVWAYCVCMYWCNISGLGRTFFSCIRSGATPSINPPTHKSSYRWGAAAAATAPTVSRP